VVLPIPKADKHKTDPCSRPIALTSCLCKIAERMINDRLVWHLEKQAYHACPKWLPQKQKHYRSIGALESFVREAFIQKQHVVAVFFDLEKAYDTTWKYGIMKDLYDAGLRGRLPLFVQGFLQNRQFQVRLGSHIYDKCKKLTSLKLIVRTMQRYHTTKTAKIFWVTLDGATHGASISCPMHSYI